MGFRLKGPAIKPTVNGILSEGICLGAIQVPADGQPIVLLNDRQTIGGYPKLGSVLSLDIGKLAQLLPGGILRFEAISIEQAHNLLLLDQQRLLLKWNLWASMSSSKCMNLNISLSTQIEDLLVARNPRGMQTLQAALVPGYYLRAAQLLLEC